jgi:hypothetical protein
MIDDIKKKQEASSSQGTMSEPIESINYYPKAYKSRNSFKIMFMCDCPADGNFLLERITAKFLVRRGRSASIADVGGGENGG